MQWTERVDTLLYDGETVERRFDLDDRVVVVTSHRVLAFTPEDEGATYAHVDRPNVAGVSVASDGDRRYLWRAIKPGLLGAGSLAFASVVSLEGVVPPLETANVDAGTPGMAGVADALGTVRSLLALLDLAMLVGGLALAGVAVFLLGAYFHSRTRELVVEVDGEDDVIVPVDDRGEELAADLREAVQPPPPAGDAPKE